MEFDFENETTEFKREFTKDIKKEVIAFANSFGGIIYVGVDKKGNYYPIEDIDETMQQITNTIRDSVSPDVTFFVRYEIEDKKIIKVTVNEGSNKPYCLKEKGLVPSGVYIRQGNTSVPASHELIRRMIKLTDGDIFEEERALIQELTFENTEHEFKEKNLKFEENNKITLGIKNKDNLYTNLGVLLSEQCAHSIKVAIFEGTNKLKFKDRAEFKGSLFKQLQESYRFLELNNKLPAKIVGLKRVERFDYPPDAMREGLLNAIIHRDYSFTGSVIINICDDRMECVSIGGLVPGMGKNELFKGISQPRNKKLAEMFLRLNYIEAYGTGLQNIMELYKNISEKPYVTTTPNSFILVLPNQNYKNPILTERHPQHKLILDFIKTNGFINNSDVQTILKIKQSRAARVLKQMVELNLIEQSEKRGNYIERA